MNEQQQKELIDLIKEAHDKLDDLNAQFGEKGRLCLCCHAQAHYTENGIIHRSICLISKLRRYT